IPPVYVADLHPRSLPSFPTRRSSDLPPPGTSVLKPICFLPRRREMMLSRPSKAPPQMNRMCVVSIWMYSCSGCLRPPWGGTLDRSEEHTSELQSRVDLVCRLLLEKKK